MFIQIDKLFKNFTEASSGNVGTIEKQVSISNRYGHNSGEYKNINNKIRKVCFVPE